MFRSGEMTDQFKVSILVVVLATVSILVPFIFRPFNMDEPLFLWSAFNIIKHPIDFYGFNLNWYGYEAPLYTTMQNPPFNAYYIALVIRVFGSSEASLHIAFLVPAIGASLGAYFLAREFCTKPLTAALVSIATPAFLVPAITIMCDVMMLAFWVWAVFFWVRGIKSNRSLFLFLSAILIFFSTVSKYFGVCLIPLLFLYTLIQKRRIGRWLFFLVIAASLILLYEWATYLLYGRGLLFQASSYASSTRWSEKEKFPKLLIGLIFTGGGLISVLFFSPFLWSRRSIVIGFISFAVVTVILYFAADTSPHLKYFKHAQQGLLFQLMLFATIGMAIIILVVADLRRNRDAASVLLFFWVVGTFIFAAYINWTNNIRSILPIAPAFGILIVRRLDTRKSDIQTISLKKFYYSLVAGLSLALLVSWADYTIASASKEAAVGISVKYAKQGHQIWFQGHWGFQYYMQRMGGKPLDEHLSGTVPGDFIVIPFNNCFLWPINDDQGTLVETIQLQPFKWLATMSLEAGFYSNIWGPVPYEFAAVPPETFYILIVK